MDYLHLGIPPVLSSLYAQEVLPSLRGTRLLLGIWCLMSTLEWLANAAMFRHDGLLSWRILSLRSGMLFKGNRFQSLFWERSIIWVLSIRIAAAIGLVITPDALLECAALLVIVGTSWFIQMRSFLGGDGADQMGQVVSIGALLIAAGIAFGQLGLSFAGTLLIAGQLLISYFVAGFSKLLSAEWRSGQAVVGVMGTHSYGHGAAARVAAGSVLFSACFCWFVILTEALFPLAMFAPHNVLIFALVAFFLFHVSTAYFMGLNTFVWAFTAAYPSIVVMNHLTTRALGLW